MDTIKALLSWGGPTHDVVQLIANPIPPSGASPSDEDDDIVLYQVLDEDEQATGPVVGVEIDDFLEFDRWTALPDLSLLWEIPGEAPEKLDMLLRRMQARLRSEVPTTAR